MRLIDADNLRKDIENLCPVCGNEDSSLVEQGEVLDFIEEQPTVDAVHVVRCRDCQKCYYDEARRCYVAKPKCPLNFMGYARMDPDGYCYRGERREVQT